MNAATDDPWHLLLPYVPEDRTRAHAAGVDLPERARGTALFADLSGFTALTEGLSATLGPDRGSEELTRHLAGAFEALIGQVRRHGGAVIGFSGDAITCWFDGDAGRAAAGAALAMQRAIAALPAARSGAAEVRLGVKVAAVHGPVRRLLVGDPEIGLLDVLAGRTLDRLASCEGRAARGQVVVDRAVAEAIGIPVGADDATVVPGDADVGSSTAEPPPEPAPGDASWARSWLAPTIRERLRAGLDGLAADFRPAAALFLSFAGIDYDHDPEAGSKLDAFVRWVQHTVASLDGVVVQLTVGDKGAYLYAAFGAPVAHDDDAARAVAAARRLRSPPQEFVRDVRIGVTYGSMYAGAYGSGTRRTYGVLGPKTNLAARLMGRAPLGGVLCDAEVARHARRRWAFERLSPLRVKGIADPIDVFAPTGPAAPTRVEGVPAGRVSERAWLERELDGLAAGRHASAACLEGDVGAGKTRLLTWLAARAESRGTAVLTAAAQPVEERVPYGAWRTIVWRLLDLQDASPDERRALVRERVAERVPELAQWSPLLATITGSDGAGDAWLESLPPELRARNLDHLMTRLMVHAAGRAPLLLILDGAQRLDSLSWDLAASVVRAAREAGAPLLLVLGQRPLEPGTPPAVALAALREEVEVRDLTLGELDPAAIVAVAAAALGVEPSDLPEPLARFVIERASGIPLYAEELVLALVDEGSVRVEGRGRVTVGEDIGADGGPAPRTLRGLVLARVDRAPEPERATLTAASVLGRRFRAEPLAVVTRAPGRADLRGRLESLVARGLLDGAAPEAYAFRHVLVHEVAYASLLFAQRRRLHVEVAAWYEGRHDLSPRELHPLLAHHYAQAAEGGGDAELARTAVRHLRSSADGDEALGAYPEAIAGYERALRIAPASDAEARADLLVALAGVLEKTGAYAPALRRCEEALRQATGDRTRAAAWACACLVHTRGGAHGEARAAGRRALDAAAAVSDATMVALVRGRLGILAALEGEFEEAQEHFDGAQRHYLQLNQPRNRAAWLNNLGLVLIFRERFDEARERLSHALRTSREAQVQDVEAQVRMNLGLAAQRQGDLDAAAHHYGASLALCRELLIRQDAVTNEINLGDIDFARGRHAEAWASYLEATAEALALGAVPKALDALRGAAEILLARGEAGRAAELLGLVLRHPAGNVEVHTEAERVLNDVRAVLDPERIRRALDRGAPGSPDEALAALRGGTGT